MIKDKKSLDIILIRSQDSPCIARQFMQVSEGIWLNRRSLGRYNVIFNQVDLSVSTDHNRYLSNLVLSLMQTEICRNKIKEYCLILKFSPKMDLMMMQDFLCFM